MERRKHFWIAFCGLVLLVAFLVPWATGQGPAASGPLRIGVFADLHAHVADSPDEKKVMTNYAERLSAFVAAMNAWPADLVIELGDLVNGVFVMGGERVDPARVPGVLEEVEKIYSGLAGPRYYVLGNHDVYDLSKSEFLERVSAPATFTSFDAGAYHIVILDAQYNKNGEDLGHTGWVVQGRIPQAELDWLRADLAATVKPTIVCVHQRLDVAFDLLAGGPQIANASEVKAVLMASGGVIAVFQGHEHESAYSLEDGIHYVTFACLVDEGTPPTWAQVTLDPVGRTIEIDGVGIEVDRHLTY